MVDKLDTFAERLKFLRKKSGLSLAAVGKQLGVSAQAVHKWENGGDVAHDRSLQLAVMFNVSPPWLHYGGEDSKVFLKPLEFPTAPVPAEDGSFVPLLPADKIFAWVDGQGRRGFHAGEWIACPGNHGGSTFAMRVQGVSMERHGDKISYSEGDIVFADPDAGFVSGSRIIVATGEGRADPALLRQLIVESGVQYQRTINPSWPEPIKEIGDRRILGTVIGRWVPE